MKKLILPIAGLIAIVVVAVIAKEKLGMDHNQHSMKHAQAMAPSKGMPTEVGEAGFAALAEIVSLLSNDPDTDWAKVNINGLREHLVMMNRLVLGAHVDEQAISSGSRFTVTGDGMVLKAIQQMVPAHAAELNKMAEFTATTKLIDRGVVIEVVGNDSATNDKINGLGFFGLMATGSHHQHHHFMMALGHGHH